jgi:hypothetical protein
LLGIGLAFCSAFSLSGEDTSPLLPSQAGTDVCTIEDATATPQEVSVMRALRSNVESGPLYTIPAAKGVAKCRVDVESGVIILEYLFKDGGWLRVKRDSGIEYTEQVAHFQLASEKNPSSILANAEHVTFGDSGCGIDWQQADTKAVTDDPSVTETLFYGDVCNCRAGIRRDAAGRVVELMLRSAC